MIRKAQGKDCKRLIELLHQVNMVHHELRPDLFRPHTTKYSEEELLSLIDRDGEFPIFVYDDGTTVCGYAFCQVKESRDDLLLQDGKTLYVDDICVDEHLRGHHIGKALFEHVRNYALAGGFHNITLNVWTGNNAAHCFYQNMGMQVQKMTMEMILPE